MKRVPLLSLIAVACIQVSDEREETGQSIGSPPSSCTFAPSRFTSASSVVLILSLNMSMNISPNTSRRK